MGMIREGGEGSKSKSWEKERGGGVRGLKSKNWENEKVIINEDK